LVDSAENDLASLDLGNTDSRDGYLAEVSTSFRTCALLPIR
jgi:hypothetical protein